MKILHTADLHLDSPFEGLSSGKAMSRRNEQRRLLKKIADTANERCVDAVVLCGDLLDSENSYYETGEELVRNLGEILAPVFIIPGNHDFYCAKSPYARMNMPENVHIFTENKMQCFKIESKKCKIYGGAYVSKEDPELLANFRVDDSEYINIVCAHGDIGEKTIEYTNADYVALGHIHKPTGIKKTGKTFYSQPGCPEGRGFDETGDRFINIVEIEKGNCCLEKVKISTRNYEKISVNVTGTQPADAIKAAIPDDAEKNIYEVTLTGETDININEKKLEEELAGCFYAVKIRNNTRRTHDIWEKCSDETLRGIFLSKLKDRYDNAEDETERKLIEDAVKWGIAAIDNMEEVACHDN